MKRYWIPKEWINDSRIDLDGDIFHHIHRVCRNEVGAKFELLAGDQKAYFVELKEAQKKSGWAEVLEIREITPLKKPYIHLALSLPRFAKMDWILEKSVEMGVAKLHPFVSDYSFVRKVDQSLLGKEKRWKKIIQSATQQSGRGELMEFSSPQTLDQLLEEFNQDERNMGLFPYEGEASQNINDAMQLFRSRWDEQPFDQIWLFVGSEGGFSQKEVRKFEELGLASTTLGEQVLRVDTACLALISIIKYEMRLMEGK